MQTHRQTDSRGRVTLGQEFANRTVIVKRIDATAVSVTLGHVIPARELWLHENKAARALVDTGLEQAATGQFADESPDLVADADLVEQLVDE